MTQLFGRWSLAAALILSSALGGAAQEASPPKEKPPLRVVMDTAKAQRLARLVDLLQVQNELNIGDQPFAQLRQLKDSEQLDSRVLMDGLSRELAANQELQPQERAEKMRRFMDVYMVNRNAITETYAFKRFDLLSESQLQRLIQIDLQDQGIAALQAEDVVKEIALTADQAQRIETLRGDYEARFRPLFKGNFLTETTVLHSKQANVQELLQERNARIEKILTQEQTAKLAALRGKMFDLTSLGRASGDLPDGLRPESRISSMLQQLLGYDAVLRELGLSPDDEAALKAAKDRYLQERRETYLNPQDKNPPEGEKLSAVQRALREQDQINERMARARQIEQSYNEELSRRLSEAQLTRLKQINWQRGLRYSVLDREGRDALGITPEQVSKILRVDIEIHRKQFAPPLIPGGPDSNPKDLLARLEKDRAEEEEALGKVLTQQQMQKLKELRGKPFDVSLLDPRRSSAAAGARPRPQTPSDERKTEENTPASKP